MGLLPIRSIIHTITTGTMLAVEGGNNGHRAKSVTFKQTFTSATRCNRIFLPPASGKVMFSQACVKNSVYRWDVHPSWTDTPPPRRLLQRTVRILLECILVNINVSQKC